MDQLTFPFLADFPCSPAGRPAKISHSRANGGGASRGSGTRSSLCWEWLRLVAEMAPRVVLWENVPGALSTNGGRDFAQLVAALDELGYGCAWRILDCQHTRVDVWPVGIPQRRRRVWLVGCTDGDVAGAAEILFEPDCLQRRAPPRRETRTSLAGGLDDRAYQTILASTQQLGNIEVLGGGLILDPGHCRAKDHAGTITGDHDARVSDAANLVIGFSSCQGTRARSAAVQPEEAATLKGAQHDAAVASDATVRRLTPEECERLMGYPINHTKIPWKGKPASQCPDGPRYQACGNGWAINCARWVLLGIHRYLSNLADPPPLGTSRNPVAIQGRSRGKRT